MCKTSSERRKMSHSTPEGRPSPTLVGVRARKPCAFLPAAARPAELGSSSVLHGPSCHSILRTAQQRGGDRLACPGGVRRLVSRAVAVSARGLQVLRELRVKRLTVPKCLTLLRASARAFCTSKCRDVLLSDRTATVRAAAARGQSLPAERASCCRLRSRSSVCSLILPLSSFVCST